VLAHSEVSSPLVRRSLISSLVASDALEPAVAAGPRSGAAPQGVVGQGVVGQGAVDRGVADKGAATGVPSGGPQR
jgi:hypothetical protein